MAWETLIFDGRTAYVQDIDIMMLRHFLLQSLAELTPESLETNEATRDAILLYIRSWEWVGVGMVMGVDLDDHLKPFADRIRPMLRLLQLTSDGLEQFGDEIPKEYLEQLINGRTHGYIQLSVRDIRKVIGRFCSVIGPAEFDIRKDNND